MIYCEKHNYLFVHIYKTGGGTINKALESNHSCRRIWPAHAKIRDLYTNNMMKRHNRLGLPDPEKCFTFGFVRNPWDRLVSWYEHIRETKRSRINDPAYRPVLINTFDQFIKHSLRSKNHFCTVVGNTFSTNQIDFLTYPNNKMVDYIGKTENLQEDFDKICSLLNIPGIILGRENITVNRKKDYREYYTEETKEIVSIVYKRDIEYFNYSF